MNRARPRAILVAVAYGCAAPGELEAAAPDVLVHSVEELGASLRPGPSSPAP
jgi:phosphoglycolate phosphatase-like HAD superfamily hydrolase